MSDIDKKTLEYLAELSKIELDKKEEEKLLKDLEEILAYFEELKSLDTFGVEPMNGGTELANILRSDGERMNTNRGAGVESFPEQAKTEDGFLKIPPVFSAE